MSTGTPVLRLPLLAALTVLLGPLREACGQTDALARPRLAALDLAASGDDTIRVDGRLDHPA